MASERERLRLYNNIGEIIGRADADTLMELLPPDGWDDVATNTRLSAEAVALRGEMAEVRGEMAEVRGEMAEVRGEMSEVRGEIAEVRGEMSELRAEMVAMEARLMNQMAAMQRNLFVAMAGFALSTWISLLVA